ncbi:MAG TPA: SET domain-containing protein-lysine N-methyltransferase [Phycisphaerae bacterium]|nr:SET domain-containing protein-lysine N-methyltransferase [Phycisphaerae bacterium]
MDRARADVVVKRSPIAGSGVFAQRRFRAGSEIATIRNLLYSLSTLPPRMWKWAIQIGEDTFTAPAKLATWDYLNHSCQPNAGISVKGAVEHLVALRNIEPGNEITIDYSTYIGQNWGWTMTCRCGERCCRRRVENFSRLPKALQRRYSRLGVVPGFLKSREACERASAPGMNVLRLPSAFEPRRRTRA